MTNETLTNDKVETKFYKSKKCINCNNKIISGNDFEEIVEHYQKGHAVIDDNRNGVEILSDVVGKPRMSDRKEKGRPIKQIENYLDTIIMDDPILAQKILRAGLSAYTNNPINLGIMAPSSEGKTYAVVRVMDLFPKEDVLLVGGMSPTAFIHQRGIRVNENNESIEVKIEELNLRLANDKEHGPEIKKEIHDLISNSKILIDLQGKIIVFLDSPQIELWDKLKPILSHDTREMEFRITQDRKGGHVTKNVVIRGYPACIFCSAKNERKSSIWEEIETRFLITSPNTDITKYKKANKLTAMKSGIPDFASEIISSEEDEKYAKYWINKIKEEIQRLTKVNKNPIWNPFHNIISESLPSNDGITMRNAQRFVTLCNIETLVNWDRNFTMEYYTNAGIKKHYVITSIHDIDNAIKIMGVTSVIPSDKLKFVSNILQPCLKEKLTEGVTSHELAEKYKQAYKKETTPKKILETYLTPLYHYGIVDSKENPDDRKQYLYRMVASPNSNTLESIKSKIIEESYDNELLVWSGIDELGRYSMGKGYINAILDHEGNAIGQNLIQKTLLET